MPAGAPGIMLFWDNFANLLSNVQFIG